MFMLVLTHYANHAHAFSLDSHANIRVRSALNAAPLVSLPNLSDSPDLNVNQNQPHEESIHGDKYSNSEWVAQHILTNAAEDSVDWMIWRQTRISRTNLNPNHDSNHVDKNSKSSKKIISDPNHNRHAAKDYWYNLSTLPRSTVLKDIRWPVFSVTIFSFLWSTLHRCYPCTHKLSISAVPHTLMAKVLGLLLVFKTNSAYGRFQEGRKIWERIHSQSRDFTRMLSLYEEALGLETVGNVRNLLASFPYLLRHHICPRCLNVDDEEASRNKANEMMREKEGGGSEHWMVIRDEIPPNDTRFDDCKQHQQGFVDSSSSSSSDHGKSGVMCCVVDRRMLPWRLLQRTLSSKDFDAVASSYNRPLWVCNRIARELVSVADSKRSTSIPFTSRERLAMLKHVDTLSSSIGQCERIHQTLVPVNYARHCLRSLTFYLMTLPLALVKDFGLKTCITMCIMSWLMFGVYQIGYSIEDPFQGSIRLSILCDNIRRDVLGDGFGGSLNLRETAFQMPVVNEEEEIY